MPPDPGPAPDPIILPEGTCEGMDPYAVFTQHARTREGYSTTVYLDSLGKPTVGIGHLVVPADGLKVGDVITDAQVMAFWYKDSAAAFAASAKQAGEAVICDPCFVAALASVNYQLGTGWRRKFPTVWALIRAGAYNAAADMLEGSLWMRQTPVRVRDFQAALRALPPKGPSCTMEPPEDPPPPELCDIAPEACEPICYGSCGSGPPPPSCQCSPPRPGALLGGQGDAQVGVSFDVFHTFEGRTEWSALNGGWDANIKAAAAYLNSGPECRQFVISYPGVVGKGSDDSAVRTGSLTQCARGDFNRHYQSYGAAIKRAGITHGLILRIGWEWNIATNPGMSPYDKSTRTMHTELIPAFRECYGQIVRSIRSACADCGLKFDYNSNSNISASLMRQGYPGDDVVDIISIEGYDNAGSKTDPVARWNTHEAHLNDARDFAKERGKYMAIPEWGLLNCNINSVPCSDTIRNAAYPPGDNPYFIQKTCEYGKNSDNKVYYSVYFGGKPTSYPWHSLTHPLNAKSKAAFIKYCGCGAPP